MSIRTRTLAGMAAVFVASAVILAALARPLLLDGFTAIEQREIQQDVERGLALYRAQLGELDRLAADWGAWDQAYAFASCPSQDFLARNVTESALANLHASMMAYLPDEDPAVYGLALDPTRQALRPMPSPLRAALLDPAHGLRLTWPGDRAQGLLVLPEGPMLVAARPVLTGAGQGPSRGTVVVGRYLDDALQEGMAASSGLPLRFLPAQQLLQDPAFARQLLADSRHPLVVPDSTQSISGYALIRDLAGQPALVLATTQERPVYAQAVAMTATFAALLAFFTLAVLGLLFYLLQRGVLSPLARLCEAVDRLGAGGDAAARIPVPGKGEFARLAAHINAMLDSLQSAAARLRDSEQRYRSLVDNARDIVFTHDMEGHLLSVNPAASAITGYSREELLAMNIADLAVPSTRHGLPAYLAALAVGIDNTYDSMIVGRNGRHIRLQVSASTIYREDGTALMVQGIARDVTERYEAERQLRYLYLHDQLTGLHNRTAFEQALEKLEAEETTPVAVIVFDLDGLKLVNNSFGSETGDRMLAAAGAILRNVCPPGGTAARIGGDELALLLPGARTRTVQDICRRIDQAVERYNQVYPDIPLSLSRGWAVRTAAAPPLRTLLRQADDAMERTKLHQSRSARSAIVNTLARALEARDFNTEGHGERLQSLVLRLARELGLPEHRMADLQLFAQFHDVGKVGIPDCILFKPGPLTSEEIAQMRRHSEIGHRIALSAPDLAPVADWILKHHEWWNGKGYPLGLAGEEIPLECRMLAIVDAYDAMTSDRPYRRAMSQEEAIAELRRCSGQQFDPYLVSRFASMVESEALAPLPPAAIRGA